MLLPEQQSALLELVATDLEKIAQDAFVELQKPEATPDAIVAQISESVAVVLRRLEESKNEVYVQAAGVHGEAQFFGEAFQVATEKVMETIGALYTRTAMRVGAVMNLLKPEIVVAKPESSMESEVEACCSLDIREFSVRYVPALNRGHADDLKVLSVLIPQKVQEFLRIHAEDFKALYQKYGEQFRSPPEVRIAALEDLATLLGAPPVEAGDPQQAYKDFLTHVYDILNKALIHDIVLLNIQNTDGELLTATWVTAFCRCLVRDKNPYLDNSRLEGAGFSVRINNALTNVIVDEPNAKRRAIIEAKIAAWDKHSNEAGGVNPTMRQLCTLTRAELGRFRNLGNTSLNELEATLECVNLRLAT